MDLAADGMLSVVYGGSSAAEETSDGAVLQAMYDVEVAWAEVLAEHGLVSEDDARALRGVAPADFDLAALAAKTPGNGNPVIEFLAQWRSLLASRDLSAVALHKSATSQDILDSALMVVIRRSASTQLEDARAVLSALVELAEDHRNTSCVSRTLTQHALPSVFGYRAATWLDGVTSAVEELEAQLGKLPLQWGGAVGTQASLVEALDKAGPESAGGLGASTMTQNLAEKLGLISPALPWHTQRQPVLRIGSALGSVVAAVGSMASDVVTLQRPEVGELREGVAEGQGGSSAMPQKRNPVRTTALLSASTQAPGILATLYQAAGSAGDERPAGAWQAEWIPLLQLTRLASGTLHHARQLLEGLSVDTERMGQNLAAAGDLLYSERLTSAFARRASGGAQAVKGAIAQAARQKQDLRETLSAILDHAPDDAEWESLTDPAQYRGRSQAFITAAVEAAEPLTRGHSI